MPKIGLQTASGGIPVQLDDTDKLAVSLYGKGTVAGDTAIGVISATVPQLLVTPRSTTGAAMDIASAGDAVSNTIFAVKTCSYGAYYNGLTWDRKRGVVAQTIAASAARTAALTNADMVNYNHSGVLIVVNVTARAVATTLTPKLQHKDSVSGEYVDVWTAAAPIDSADGTFTFLIMTGTIVTTGSYTEKVNMAVGKTTRIIVTPSDASSVTYSVAVSWML